MRNRVAKQVLIWVGLMAVAFACDTPVKEFLFAHQFHLDGANVMRETWWALAMKSPADIRVMGGFLLLLLILKQLPWRKTLVVLLGAMTGGIADVIKDVVGRSRPVRHDQLQPWMDVHPLSWGQPHGFPSSHAMVAFAAAICLARYLPRWRYLIYGIAAMVAAERVLEVAHQVSDVVAAAGLGLLTGSLCLRWLGPWSERGSSQCAELGQSGPTTIENQDGLEKITQHERSATLPIPGDPSL